MEVGTVRIRAPVMLLVLSLLCGMVWAVPQKSQNADRPTVPYGMLSPSREDIEVYDSNAAPVATISAALLAVNRTGWDMITEYFPTLGARNRRKRKGEFIPVTQWTVDSLGTSLAKAPALSPMPLLCTIWSLPESDVSGPLKKLDADTGF